MLSRLLVIAACALALGLVVAGCGNDEELGVDEPAREGLALPLGGVDYNVFITRQLNPSVPPDEAYTDDLPEPPPGQVLYGIFLEACNPSDDARQTVESFVVEDNQGNEFEPEELPVTNDFAYHPEMLDPQECIPRAGSVAQLGPAGASMLLFQLPLDITENRPLELHMENPSGDDPEGLTFELDL